MAEVAKPVKPVTAKMVALTCEPLNREEVKEAPENAAPGKSKRPL